MFRIGGGAYGEGGAEHFQVANLPFIKPGFEKKVETGLHGEFQGLQYELD